MSVDRNIRLVSLYTVAINAAFIVPIIVPFYRDQMNLTFQDFLIAEACFAAVVVLFEVPSGWLSDVWQRKHVLALGAFFDVLGMLCLIIGDNIWWAIAAQSIIGIAISLMSGTHTAMLYDSLLSAGREGEYRKREGKRGALQFYSVAAASVVGGLLYPIHHMAPLILEVGCLTIGIIAACLMVEPTRHRKIAEKHPVADMIETARYALHGHADVGMIILFASVMFCSTKLIMWTQQPYYMALHIDESLFGILMAAGFLMAGMSSHVSHLLDGKVGSVQALLGVWVVAVAVCIASGLSLGYVGVGLLMLGGSVLYGIAAPRVSEAINSRVGSERRATILSTQSLICSLFFIPTSIGMGWIAENYTIGAALLAIAAWLGLAGIALALVVVRRGGRRVMML